jgi:polysaccharide pyruvyl transferase WcaK-like protein
MRKDVASLFDHAIAPVVRDDASAQYLHDWGVRNPVEVKVDAVVTASREDLLSGLGQVPASLSLAKSGYDGLIGVHTEVRPSGDDLELARGLVDWILKNTRYAVALISDGQRAVKSRAWHKDVQIDEAHKNRVVPLLYSGEPGDMIAILNDLDLVVTTKLHVGIVRCALGKSVIAAPKHSKTPRFYEQMGLADWCVPHGATDRLGRTVALLQAWLAGKRPSFAKFEQRRSVGFYRDRLAKTVEGRALS